MKTRDQLKTFRSQDEAALSEKLKETQEELFKLRIRHAAGQLEQTSKLEQLRRDVARIKTILREQRA